MKHSRITIIDDNKRFAAALNKADNYLRKRIKKLKEEGRISETMMITSIKLALLNAGFLTDTRNLRIGSGREFCNLHLFTARCPEFPVIFEISIDTL